MLMHEQWRRWSWEVGNGDDLATAAVRNMATVDFDGIGDKEDGWLGVCGGGGRAWLESRGWRPCP
tara:strand:+ start:24586 stop:24780 length:195 start_codon:yes stop_codon:yes gene_type:complete